MGKNISNQIVNPNANLLFFECLIDLYGCPVEYDLKLRKISFLLFGSFPVILKCKSIKLENQIFFLILLIQKKKKKVELDEEYPNVPPIIAFQSFYHPNKSESPSSSRLLRDHISWSKKWDEKEMASRLKEHIFDLLPKFRDNCVNKF